MAPEYPAAPVVAVGGVIVLDGRVVIVRRGREPRKGEWSLPGGRVELGETLIEATRREMREETGLDVTVGPLVELFDRVHADGAGRVRYHFVIADFLCTPAGGTLCAGSDAEDARWVSIEELPHYGLNPHAEAVLRKGLERNPDAPRPEAAVGRSRPPRTP